MFWSDPINASDPTGLDPTAICGEDDDDCGADGVAATSSSPVSYTSGDITGYDAAGNPVVGDPDTSTSVTVNDGVTGDTSSSTDGVLNAITSVFGYNSQIPLHHHVFGSFLNNTANNLNPFTPGLSTLAEGSAGIAGRMTFNQALKYGATTASKTFGTSFLIYPFKSSVFRGLLSRAGILAEAGPLAGLVVAEMQAIVTEWQASRSGACQ